MFFSTYFRMYGLFQTSFYFGYMAVFSTALGIMCGEFLLLDLNTKTLISTFRFRLGLPLMVIFIID